MSRTLRRGGHYQSTLDAVYIYSSLRYGVWVSMCTYTYMVCVSMYTYTYLVWISMYTYL